MFDEACKDLVPIHIHTYIHTYIHACMHACMHAYIRTYIHKLFTLEFQSTLCIAKLGEHKNTVKCYRNTLCTYTYIYISTEADKGHKLSLLFLEGYHSITM